MTRENDMNIARWFLIAVVLTALVTLVNPTHFAYDPFFIRFFCGMVCFSTALYLSLEPRLRRGSLFL